MRLLISLSALLISTLFVQMGIGSLRPFDAISGQALGFSPVQIGLLASGHFAGFLLGCIFSPHLVRRAGHSRAFAVMAGVPLKFSYRTKSLGVTADHGGFNFPLHWGPPWGPPLYSKYSKLVDPQGIDEFRWFD